MRKKLLIIGLVGLLGLIVRAVLMVLLHHSSEPLVPPAGVVTGISISPTTPPAAPSATTTTITTTTTTTETTVVHYQPSSTEKYLIDNLVNWDVAKRTVSACEIWRNENGGKIYNDLQSYRNDLNTIYTPALTNFQPIPDLMEIIRKQPYDPNDNRTYKTKNQEICKSTTLHPEGLPGLFPNSQLSKGHAGYMEPLMTPMRHPDFCMPGGTKALFNLNYLIHDFEALCNKLKPTSRRIFLDVGADLSKDTSPVVRLLDLYSKFGFEFDHIYGLEIEFTEPSKVFKDQLPKKYMSSFHWINAGAESDKSSNLNPLYSILTKFNKDDLIVVKIDISHSALELTLTKQLLDDERFHDLVDVFYFEHHVWNKEMAVYWGDINGSLKDTFDMFHSFRQNGIAAHFWV